MRRGTTTRETATVGGRQKGWAEEEEKHISTLPTKQNSWKKRIACRRQSRRQNSQRALRALSKPPSALPLFVARGGFLLAYLLTHSFARLGRDVAARTVPSQPKKKSCKYVRICVSLQAHRFRGCSARLFLGRCLGRHNKENVPCQVTSRANA